MNNEFLELNSPEEFWRLVKENIKLDLDRIEHVSFMDSLGRILAEDLESGVNLPPFNRSTVDGFAVRAADTAGASESLPVYLKVKGEVFMGEAAGIDVKPGEAVTIPTGGIVPEGADAVLMVEYTEYLDEQTIETSRAVAVGENLVEKGEDIREGEALLKTGHQIRPQDIGALAGLGITEVPVYARPEVAIISTGDELVSPEAELKTGEIRDINSYSIGSLLNEIGCRTRIVGIVEDTFPALKRAVKDNLDADFVLVSGGSSVGVKDMTIDVLNSLGEPGVLLHGISIKPGKPTILAAINGKPVMGLPGHPASAWTIANKLVVPLARVLKGEAVKELNPDRGDELREFRVTAVLSRNLVSDRGREEYIPVRLILNPSQDRSDFIAEPIPGKSSLITTLVEADGYIEIDTYREGLNRGDRVEVELFGWKGDRE